VKNHELLDLIGGVNEDYVRAADSDVVRPRFQWKGWAAAACAALVLCAYPVWRMTHADRTLEQNAAAPLHAYTVAGGGGSALTEEAGIKAPAGVPDPEPTTIPEGAYIAGQRVCHEPGQDAAVDEEAAGQYDGLLQGMGGEGGGEPDAYPEWFAGAWIDHGGAPAAPAWLTVAIVDGFRTSELEARVLAWCGGTGKIEFRDAKYSHDYLNSLMDPVVQLLDDTSAGSTGLTCGIGVNVVENCLGVDVYGSDVPDCVLAGLSKLDPDGDAIRVRLFPNSFLEPDVVKGPAAEPAVEPVPGGARAEPAIEKDEQNFPDEDEQVPAQTSAAPGVQETSMPAYAESGQPARNEGRDDEKYNLLGGADGLPGFGLLY